MIGDLSTSTARLTGVVIERRRARERAARHQFIIQTAREIAETDGWDAVTTRRLADTIEYSQPVLYSHFANKDAIVAAVAIQGFTELAERLHQARLRAANEQQALAGVAQAYLDFGLANPALYDAMSGLTWVYRLVRPKHHERSTPGSRSYAPR